MKKRTGWFRNGEKPAYNGVYECDDNIHGWYRLYKHGWWYSGGRSPNSALIYPTKLCNVTDFGWRGLAVKP